MTQELANAIIKEIAKLKDNNLPNYSHKRCDCPLKEFCENTTFMVCMDAFNILNNKTLKL